MAVKNIFIIIFINVVPPLPPRGLSPPEVDDARDCRPPKWTIHVRDNRPMKWTIHVRDYRPMKWTIHVRDYHTINQTIHVTLAS